MNELINASTTSFFGFLLAGSVIVYLILKFDSANRRKFNKVMLQAKDVQPMLMRKSAQQKLHNIQIACKESKIDRRLVEKQLDELVSDYDKGHITLPEYCTKLNRLVSMTA